jgi:outer membrane protein assembly factor BamB
LWSEPLENSLYARLRTSVDEGGMGVGGLDGGLISGRLLVSLPTLAGSTVLVNEGYVLRAFDAYSHQPRWYQFMGAPNSPRADAQAGDVLAVTVDAGRVLALSGHALATERSGGGRIVAIDLETGARRWEFAAERLRSQPEFAGVFFYGAPTVAGNTVIVLGRKVTARTETVCTVFGFSIDTGEMRFATPAGSAPGIRIGGARPFTTPVVRDGLVFAATGGGVTLCLDPTDGRIDWLRRDSVPVRETPQENMPWETGSIAVCTRGLVTVTPSGDAVQLLDAATGKELESMPTGTGTTWGKPRYFLADRSGERIYSIGDGLVAFASSDLHTPLWRLSSELSGAGAENEAILAAAQGAGIRGRVQSGWLANGRPALIVPFLSDAVVLHGDDGTPMMRIACRGPSNLVARDGIVAAATAEDIEVFMDAARAQRILVDAVKSDPSDPDAVIGLVEFALRSRDADLLSRACTQAAQTLREVSDDEARRLRLSGLLIDAAQSSLLARAVADGLFDAIVTASSTPDERALALLAQGDWFLGTERATAAVHAWQAILADANAAAALVRASSLEGAGLLLQSGALAATARLVALSRIDGGAVAKPRSDPTAPTSDLAARARLATATPDEPQLWLAAARDEFAKGRGAAGAGFADAALASAIASRDASRVSLALDGAQQILRDAKLEWSAAQLLDRALVAGFDPPVHTLRSERVSTLLARSSASAIVQGSPRPRVACASSGVDSVARLMRGVLAPTREVAGGEPLGSAAYLIADRTLTRLVKPDLAPAWTVPLMGDLRFVAASGSCTLIVEQVDRESVDVAAVDPDGGTRWRIEDVAMAITGRQPSFSRSECVLFPSASDLLAVRADGWVASFSLEDSERTWHLPRVIEQVDCADASETMAVLGGVRATRDEQSSWLVAVDRKSGERIAQTRTPGDEALRWVRAIDAGAVVFGTTRGIGRWQIFGGAPGIQWFVMAANTRSTVSAEAIGQRIVASDGTGRTSVLDIATGEPLPDAFAPTGGGRPMDSSRRWLRVGGTVATWTNNGIDLFSVQGAESGGVVLHGARRIEGVLPSACALIAIEQGDGAEEPREFGFGRQAASVLLHRFGWEDGGRIASAPILVELHDGRLDRSQLVDGWVLLGGPQTTLAVPLP